jgi:signal peptide peptidase SppA
MPHDIRRILQAFATRPWFIDPRKAAEIAAMLELRARLGPRNQPWRGTPAERPPIASLVEPSGGGDARSSDGSIAVLRLYGSIVPRMERLEDVSQTAASLVDFGRAFDAAASNPNVKGIVIDVDSPGGTVDLVPETAARIREAKRADRPIIAVANTLAASAAYWIASAADELVVTPSGEVGSIGVYMMHEDVSEFLRARGVIVTFIAAGPRKVEGNAFEPLSAEARSYLQDQVLEYYEMFTRDVALARGVPQSVVKADPEESDRHFGGGRTYIGRRAVELGMADRVATLEETIARLQAGAGETTGASRRRASTAARRRQLDLIAARSAPTTTRRRRLALLADGARAGCRGGRLEIDADAAGHYRAPVTVDGFPTPGIIDTGASFCALPFEVAAAAGLPVQALTFDTTARTAAGPLRVAATTVARLNVQGLEQDDVEVTIHPPGTLNEVLVGMSWLAHLSRVEIRGGRLVLES